MLPVEERLEALKGEIQVPIMIHMSLYTALAWIHR